MRWHPRVADDLLHRPLASRWSLPSRATRPAASRAAPTAATATPPWNGRCRACRPLLASARALHIPQTSIPFAIFLSPRSHASERRRRTTPNPGELTPPRSRHCRPAPPLQPPPLAAPRPSAASQPLLVARTPPEPPRRRAPSTASRRSPSTPHL